MLIDQIKEDLKKSFKEKDKEKINSLKYVVSETQRLKDPHNISDQELIKIINKLINSEKEVLEYQNLNPESSRFIKILEEYLPRTMPKSEIEDWLYENMPEVFESGKNERMKYMKKIMSNLGSNANGSDVKEVLINPGNF